MATKGERLAQGLAPEVLRAQGQQPFLRQGNAVSAGRELAFPETSPGDLVQFHSSFASTLSLGNLFDVVHQGETQPETDITPRP